MNVPRPRSVAMPILLAVTALPLAGCPSFGPSMSTTEQIGHPYSMAIPIPPPGLFQDQAGGGITLADAYHDATHALANLGQQVDLVSARAIAVDADGRSGSAGWTFTFASQAQAALLGAAPGSNGPCAPIPAAYLSTAGSGSPSPLASPTAVQAPSASPAPSPDSTALPSPAASTLPSSTPTTWPTPALTPLPGPVATTLPSSAPTPLPAPAATAQPTPGPQGFPRPCGALPIYGGSSWLGAPGAGPREISVQVDGQGNVLAPQPLSGNGEPAVSFRSTVSLASVLANVERMGGYPGESGYSVFLGSDPQAGPVFEIQPGQANAQTAQPAPRATLGYLPGPLVSTPGGQGFAPSGTVSSTMGAIGGYASPAATPRAAVASTGILTQSDGMANSTSYPGTYELDAYSGRLIALP